MAGTLTREYPMNGDGSAWEAIGGSYLFVSVLNNTPYTVSLYKGTPATPALGDRFGFVSPWCHTTIPVPAGLTIVTAAWTGSTQIDKLTLVFSETSLGIQQSFAPPSGTQTVAVSGIVQTDVTDRPSRQLGQVEIIGGSGAAAIGDPSDVATLGDGSLIAVTKQVRDDQYGATNLLSALSTALNDALGTSGSGEGTDNVVGLLKRVRTMVNLLEGVISVKPAAYGGVQAAHVTITTTAAALPDIPAPGEYIFQNDKANTVDILVGDISEQRIEIAPGGAIVVNVTSPAIFYAKTASGTATLSIMGTV